MSETITASLPLTRWQGDRGTYHLVIFTGAEAEALSTHAFLHKLEFGRARGFGSIKVTARVGDTVWRTSVFPQKKPASNDSGMEDQANHDWILLVSKKVMRAEDIAPGDLIDVSLAL